MGSIPVVDSVSQLDPTSNAGSLAMVGGVVYVKSSSTWSELARNAASAARVIKTSTTALASTGAVVVSTFDTARFDTDSYFSAAAGTKLTVPFDGIYCLMANVALASQTVTSAGYAEVNIRKNGTQIVGKQLVDRGVGMSFALNMNVSAIDRAVTGDYYELTVGCLSTAALNIASSVLATSSALGHAHEFSIMRLE